MQVLTAMMLALLAMACRADRGGGGSSQRVSPGDTTTMGAAPDSLALALLLPERIRSGERVSLRLRVENRSGHALDLYLRGRTITFDVILSRADGRVVWRRLEGEIIPAIVQLRTLAPAERLELEATWDQRTNAGSTVEPGEYAARGLLLVEGEPLATPTVAFRIVPRGG